MVKYFDTDEMLKVKKQRKLCLAVYFAVFAVYLISVIAFIVYTYNLPYGKSPLLYKIVQYAVSALFVIFSFIYLGVKFRRVNRYYRFTVNLATGLRETTEAAFIEYDETLHDKDGVDCKALVFLEWNKYKKEYYERKVLVFYEKDFPEIAEGAQVKFVTQGNFLIEYEITGVKNTEEGEV